MAESASKGGPEAQKITQPCAGNKFSNDGSFLEMFKKQMAEKNSKNVKETEATESCMPSINTNLQTSNSTQNKTSNHRLKIGVLPLVSSR